MAEAVAIKTEPKTPAVSYAAPIAEQREALKGGMPAWKYLSNRMLTIMLNLVYGTNLGEFHSGFRAYRREVLEKVDFESDSDAFGFDAVKLDGCGAATNMTYYAELMAATGRSYVVENCHWGKCGADAWYHNPDGSSCHISLKLRFGVHDDC